METIHLPVYFIYGVATFSDFCHPESGSEHSHCIIPTRWLSPVGQEPCVTGWETGPSRTVPQDPREAASGDGTVNFDK